MTPVTYNRAAAERELRQVRANHWAEEALTRNESQFERAGDFALYVFCFFVVTSAAVFAVLQWWPL